MSTRVNINAQTTHWEPNNLGQYGPVCGIHKRTIHWSAVCIEELKGNVTCDHCLAWIAERQLPATREDIDERVANMTFDNDTSDDKIEAAIERGIKAGLEKVKADFFNSPAVGDMLRHLVKSSLRSVLNEPVVKLNQKNLVERGVTNALQRGEVRTNLIGIHKIAVDEIGAEWERENPNFEEEDAENRKREVQDALREVLDEAAPGQTGAGVGTHVYNVSVLTSRDVYDATREALQDDDEETLSEYEENETALMQKAVASVAASDEFQALFKKLVKEAVEEKMREDRRRADNIATGTKPPVHFRRRYRTTAACGYESGDDTNVKNDVTCHSCRRQLNLI